MLKSLLLSSSVSLILLLLPAGSGGVSLAHAIEVDFVGGILLGGDSDVGPWLGVGLGDFDELDDDDDYDQGYFDGFYDRFDDDDDDND